MTEDAQPSFDLLPPVVFEAVASQHRPPGASVTGQAMPSSRLPLANIHTTDPRDRIWAGVTTMDNRGRLSIAGATRYLGWPIPASVHVTVSPTIGRIMIALRGAQSVSGRGHLHLGSAVRKSLFLSPGDQLLLVALPDPGVISGLCAAAVARLLNQDGSALTAHDGEAA